MKKLLFFLLLSGFVLILLEVGVSILYRGDIYTIGKCIFTGGEWSRLGGITRYCKYTYSDAGNICSTNKDCQSRKCVIGEFGNLDKEISKKLIRDTSSTILPRDILPADASVFGKCSLDNHPPCYSGEIVVEDDRSIPPGMICE